MKTSYVREISRHEPETHVAAVCLRIKRGKIYVLVGKRTSQRELYPNYWECGGGHVPERQSFNTAIIGQMKQEFGIDVVVLQPFATYTIETQERFIPGIRFLCKLKHEWAVVKPDQREFKAARWIPEEELNDLDFIPGLKDSILEAIRLYKHVAS
jgi:8-oxo-dGTP pyrophosphatase MutT (NUDIX family)